MRTNSFWRDAGGNFAVITAMLLMPLLVACGILIDGTRWYALDSELQDALDRAVVGASVSTEQDVSKLKAITAEMFGANMSGKNVSSASIVSFGASSDSISATAQASVDAIFSRILNYEKLEAKVTAKASRVPINGVEIALVLDNTFSMSTKMPTGETRLEALKKASISLVKSATSNKSVNVRIAVVPYAANVNVGKKFKNASWISGSDQTSSTICRTRTTAATCVAWTPAHQCMKQKDGVFYSTMCSNECTQWVERSVPPYQDCRTKQLRWEGCVWSRISNSYLDDKNPGEAYPAFMQSEPYRQCMSELLELTNDVNAVTNAIDGLVYTNGANAEYKPETYMPAGLVWGLNALSPTEPLNTARPYDKSGKNKDPRKIEVLMTDGDNTMRIYRPTGEHVLIAAEGSSKTAKETNPAYVSRTNYDTGRVCDYTKKQGIEIYTVAFMVTDEDAQKVLASCASDSQHNFSATDSHQLVSAFETIARSLSDVRVLQ